MGILRSMQKRTKKAVKGLRKQLTSSSSSSSTKKSAPPLEIQLCDTEEALVLERLANSLQWETKALEVNVTVGASTSSSPASAKTSTTSTATTTTNSSKNDYDDETQRSLLFATIGQLPLLTALTIQTQQSPTRSTQISNNSTSQTKPGQALRRTRMRMSDVAVCLQGASIQIQSLKLSDVTLVGSKNEQHQLDDLIGAITSATSVRHVELHRCLIDAGTNTNPKDVWDRILGACAALPLLESLHLTGMPTVQDDCRNELSPSTLRALYNAPLRDLQLNGDWNIQASHIQALQERPVASKLQKLSLGCPHWNTERIHALALFVQQQSSLRELYLTKVQDTDTDGTAKQCPSVRNATTLMTTTAKTSPLTILIQSLAHTQLTHLGLMGVNASELRAVPHETWRYMWDHNCVLQHLEVPSSSSSPCKDGDDAALTEQVRADNLFWLNLNKAGRSYLSRTDQVHPSVLLQVLSHPNTNGSVQALYYFLSATHPCLIPSS